MDLQKSFKLLGIDPGADPMQAKRAYKAQVRRWHPDQFPQGSPTRARAEEQLKQINVAYDRVKAHLSIHRPAPTAAASAPPPRPPQDTAGRHDAPGKKEKKRSWFDHMFDALNTLAGSRAGEPPTAPSGKSNSSRRQTFGQVLDEMAGGTISLGKKRPPKNPAAGCRRCRRRGGTVGAVGGTESPGPVKPVGRVRGIGRSR